MMDVHLHARFVNLHIVSSARRLTHQELATTEAHAEHRYQEAQFLLYHWTGWLNRVETEQCRILLTYKVRHISNIFIYICRNIINFFPFQRRFYNRALVLKACKLFNFYF